MARYPPLFASLMLCAAVASTLGAANLATPGSSTVMTSKEGDLHLAPANTTHGQVVVPSVSVVGQPAGADGSAGSELRISVAGAQASIETTNASLKIDGFYSAMEVDALLHSTYENMHHAVGRLVKGTIVPLTRASVNSGHYLSLALHPSSGNAYVTCYNQDSTNLEIHICHDPLCTNSTSKTLDVSSSSGLHSSLQFKANGNPAVAYRNANDQDLVLIVCADPYCQSSTTPLVMDATGNTGDLNSLAISSEDIPCVSFRGNINGGNDLRFAQCTTAACTASSVVDVHTTGEIDRQTSLVLASSDQPLIAFYERTAGKLMLAVCGAGLDCSSPTIQTLDSGPNAGSSPSLVLSSGGLPRVAYVGNGHVMLAICTDGTCAQAPTLVVIDAVRVLTVKNRNVALRLDSNDYPVIAYGTEDDGDKDMYLCRCHDPLCTSKTIRSVATAGVPGHSVSLALAATTQHPVMAFEENPAGSSRLHIAICQDSTCL